MKENIRYEARIFSRTFAYTFFLTLCPLMLLYGCMIADNNTRMLGFDDTTPAVVSYTDQDGMHIKVFGGYFLIPEKVLSTAGKAAGYAWIAVPPAPRLFIEYLLTLPEYLKEMVPDIFRLFSG